MKYLIVVCLFILCHSNGFCQVVIKNNLPAILTLQNGKEMKTSRQWTKRRGEILKIMTLEMYRTSRLAQPKERTFLPFGESVNALNFRNHWFSWKGLPRH